MPARRKTLSRQDWVVAARKVFVASGVDDVKVDRLARRLKISRGSFYWHFHSRKDLLDALLRDWESRNREEIQTVRERWASSSPDLVDVVGIWLGEDPAYPTFDMAVRVWARKSAAVAEVVHGIDDAWIKLLEILFRHDGRGEIESFARARVAYFHQIGYYAMGVKESRARRVALAELYYRALTGFPEERLAGTRVGG